MTSTLVLTRRVGEKILLNNGEVVIEVVATRGRTVRLAFRAAKEISIRREEAPILSTAITKDPHQLELFQKSACKDESKPEP